MASFPSVVLQPDDIKIRYLEPFASQALDKRLTGLPLGVSEGFAPSLADPVVTLAVGPRGFSLASALSIIEKVSVGIFVERSLTFDFTGHDFTASGDVWLVLKTNYALGGTTTSQIVTQNVSPIGETEIAICRVTGTGTPGSGGTVDSVVFAAAPDRHTVLATADQPFGFMGTGAVEQLAEAFAGVGKLPVATTVRSAGFAMAADDANKLHLLDMLGIAANEVITLPDAANLNDGDRIAFLSLTGLPGGFNLSLVANNGSDAIMFQGLAFTGPIQVPQNRKTIGHFWVLTLAKAATTGLTENRWYLSVDTLPRFHGALHNKGSTDPIRLDALDDPLDNTDLDASTLTHGLLPKLSGSAADVFRGDGSFGSAPAPSVVIFHPIILAPAGPHPINADGTIYRLDVSAPIQIDLPDSAGLPNGAIARLQADIVGSAVAINTLGVADKIRFPNGLPLDTLGWTPGNAQDALEFVLDKDVASPPLWKLNRFVRPPFHAATHQAGGDDPLSVLNLAGFPGLGVPPTFLRDDGSFAIVPGSDGNSPFYHANYLGSLVAGNRLVFNGGVWAQGGIVHSVIDGSFTVPVDGTYAIHFFTNINQPNNAVELRSQAGTANVYARAVANTAAGNYNMNFSALLGLFAAQTFDLVLTAGGVSAASYDTQVAIYRVGPR